MASDWYVRPEGGNYGVENGTSYQNAWDGLGKVVWGPGGVQPGDILYVCGVHIYNMTGKAAGNKLIRPTAGAGDSSRVIIRGDYSGDPGILWGVAKINYGSWVSEGSGTYSLRSEWCGTPYGWEYFFFENISGDDGTRLKVATSVQNCKDTPGSVYSPDEYGYNGTIYVHLSDGSSPVGKLYAPGVGWVFYNDNKSYITYKNLTQRVNYMIFYDQTGSYLRWEGGDYKYAKYALFSLGENHHHIEIYDCSIHYAKNGIYAATPSMTGGVYNCTFHGNTIYDCGIAEGIYDSDAHGIGVQGGHDNVIEDNEIYNCGTGITLYAFTNQPMKNTIIRRNYCHDMHNLGGANNRGIEFNCDNNSLSDKTGNKAYQNIVANLNYGYKVQLEDTVELYNNVAYNCGTSFHSARTYDVYGPNVKARNNISLNPTTSHVVFATSGTSMACDYNYNLYYPDGANKFGGYDFAGWKAQTRPNCVFDPNSLIGDPLFEAPNACNYRLLSASPAIDAGIYVGLDHDSIGTSIPQGFSPDLGPYECIKSIYSKVTASRLSGEMPLYVEFLGSAMGDYPPFSYAWDFGDGHSSMTQKASHTYRSSGEFSAVLTVTDNKGNEDSKRVVITAIEGYCLKLSVETGVPALGDRGTTDPPPAGYIYAGGSTKTVSAINYPRYRYAHWNGDVNQADSF